MCDRFAISRSSAGSATAPCRPSKPCGGVSRVSDTSVRSPNRRPAIETLAKLGTARAKQLLVDIVTARDLPPPLLPAALSAARSAALHLPANLRSPAAGPRGPADQGTGRKAVRVRAARYRGARSLPRRYAAGGAAGGGHRPRTVRRRPGQGILLSELQRTPTGEIVEALSAIADDDIVVHLGRCAKEHPALAGRIAMELEEMETPRSLRVARRIRGSRPDSGVS